MPRLGRFTMIPPVDSDMYLQNNDPTIFVQASSQMGVGLRVRSPSSVKPLAERITGDTGEVLFKSFLTTEESRQTTQQIISYVAYAWILVGGAILSYLANLAFYPRLKSWWLLRASRKAAEVDSDEDSSDEEETIAPKALLPSSVDARIAYEAQAYAAS